MNYSKRQLYALGETLGDSVTQRKAGGGYVCGGGGGGGGFGGIANAVGNQLTAISPSNTGYSNQGTPAPDPINPAPEAAPTPIASQGVQMNYGASTNATPITSDTSTSSPAPQQTNPFTGGLGGYGGYNWGRNMPNPYGGQYQSGFYNPYGGQNLYSQGQTSGMQQQQMQPQTSGLMAALQQFFSQYQSGQGGTQYAAKGGEIEE